MARKTNVKVNGSGVVSVLKSPGVTALVGREAQSIASRANSMAKANFSGDPYGSRTKEGRFVMFGLAETLQDGAVFENAKNNTLKKAVR